MDYTILIALAIVVAGACYLIERYWKYKKVAAERQVREQIKQKQALNVDGMIDGVIAAFPQIEQTYLDTKAQTDALVTAGKITKEEGIKQLMPLKGKYDQAKFVVDNEWWVRPAAPYIDNIAKGVLKWFM